jgi:phosphotransferase system enzyme I (PtsI)
MQKGIPASPGIVIGKVFLLSREAIQIKRTEIKEDSISEELGRLDEALEKTRSELSEIRERISREIGEDYGNIFGAHILMLEDPMLVDEARRKVREERVGAEYALYQTLGEVKQIFQRIKDPYVRERSADIHDVGWHLILNLTGGQGGLVSGLTEKAVVVAHDLTPTDTARMPRDKVIALATDLGSRTSHTAIIARSMGVPAVVGLKNVTQRAKTGDAIIVDGNSGSVIVRPEPVVVEQYKRMQEKFFAFAHELGKMRDLPAQTIDGRRVTLAANIELPAEVDIVHAHGGDGIGLYRTEFLYMNRTDLPSEEEQFVVYREMATAMAPKTSIIRTFDIGGDKFPPRFYYPHEPNPFLGCRAIRLSLKETEVFKEQLRAILRASAYGPLKIMLPMISGLEELIEAKRVIDSAKGELRSKGVAFNEAIEVGIMVEVPSAAMTADLLAQEADFFSIGTNDLTQYLIAVDRGNENINYLYEPLHPGVLRLIKRVVDCAHEAGIAVGMCGEMAGDPLCTLLLLGLGLDELSMSPVVIPEVKKVVRASRMEEAAEVVGAAYSLSTAREITDYLKTKVKDKLPEIYGGE